MEGGDVTDLVRYDAARQALAECVRVDEAKDIRDRAAALAAYARQRDDTEMQVWVSEIHLRACQRIGQLSRELETATHGGAGGGSKSPPVGRSKTAALADAGISTSAAQRYEELAGGTDQQGQVIGLAAAEKYFAQSRSDKQPATMNGLRVAVRAALRETFGEPPQRAQRSPPKSTDNRYIDFVGRINELAGLADFDAAYLAARSLDFPTLIEADRANCIAVIDRIRQFLDALDRGKEHDEAQAA
jgi:hypothetical protein